MRALALLLAICAPCLLSPVLAAQVEHSTPDGLSNGDWSSIRAAYEAGRHQAFAVEDGLQARNPGHGWLMEFDGRGIAIQPDAGKWSWGLELQSYGFAGKQYLVQGLAESSADGDRVTYAWNADLEEWYVNRRQGLEHGYTLARRPEGGTGPLVFEIAVLGGLTPEPSGEGRGMRFLGDDGSTVLTYSGLLVVDSEGSEQPASLQATEEGIRIVIDETQAVYPLTIDPLVQVAYLKASNADTDDGFGISVAISGDLVVVGALGEASNATGVNGNQSDNSAVAAGAAYVFERSGGAWSQQAYLKASNAGALDFFGASVAISGDLVVVGASGENSIAMGVNGDQSDNSTISGGAAYVFERNGVLWSQQAYLKASNTGQIDRFGYSVAISGELVVVGARLEASNATGVDGDQSDNGATGAGAAYVFERNAGVWSQQAYLKASNTGFDDQFGYSVAISGELVVVGAFGESSNAMGVNGNQSDNGAISAGAAYVFERSAGVWGQQAYLKASNTGFEDLFGYSVAISGELVVVGAFAEGSRATGVNGNQSDNSADAAGAAYVFEGSGGVWSQQAYLKASNTGTFGSFGYSVAISDDLVVVGAKGEGSNATGVNGNQLDSSAVAAGAAYVFERSGGVWSQQAYLKASNTDSGDQFGLTVAISGDLVVVGASGEDSSAAGVNGNQLDNSVSWAGAAYVFEVDTNHPVGTNYCSPAVPNSTGVPASIIATGSAAVMDNHLTLTASDLPMNSFGMFLTGQTQGFVQAPGGSQGNLCMVGGLGRYGGPGQIMNSGMTGSISLTLDLTMTPQPAGFASILAGETWNFQAWYRDTNPNPTSNFTNALSITFQ